jgi:Mrp family chromosome partitioning ATPase
VAQEGSESRQRRPGVFDGIVQALRAYAAQIALAALAVAVVAYGLSLISGSRYRATARITGDTSITTDAASTTGAVAGADAGRRRLGTNVALVTSAPVLDAAAAKLGRDDRSSLVGKVTVAAARGADVIDITAVAGDARRAAATANAVASAFLARRAAFQRMAVARTRGALNDQIAQLGASPDRAAEVAALRSKIDDLVVSEANAGQDLQLADPARPPSRAFAPRPLRTAAWALLATLLVGVLVVALREWRRPTASSSDVERLAGVPLLAALPALPPESVWDRGLEALLSRGPRRVRDAMSRLAARRRRARTARRERVRMATDDGLRFLLAAALRALPPGGRHVIQITSARRGEHSAHVAAGLARGLAQAGQDTLVLTSDLPSRQLADALGVASAPGLAQALERAQDGTAVRLRPAPVPGLDMLHVVPGGGRSHDGVGLVRPGAVDELFASLGSTAYRYIVVDAPALLVAPEGDLIARGAEAAIIVCAGRPSAEDLAKARRALELRGVRVLGAVSLPARSMNGSRRRSRPLLRPRPRFDA